MIYLFLPPKRFLVLHALNYIVIQQLDQFPRAAIIKYHKSGGLTQQNVFPHRSGGQKSEVQGWQGHAFSEGSRGEPVPCLSLTFWCGQKSLVFLGLQTPYSNLCLWHPIMFCQSISCSVFPLLLKTPVILYQGPTLLHYDLISTNCICNGPISKPQSPSEVLGRR